MKPSQALTDAEATALLHELSAKAYTPHTKFTAARNVVIAQLMLEAGCRVGDVHHLLYSDVHWLGQVRENLQIREAVSKYHVPGLIPISAALKQAILEYDTLAFPTPPTNPDVHYIFDANPASPLSTRQIRRALTDAAKHAIPRHFHPHMLRHTFGARMRRVTNSATLQQLLRHKHLSSTEVYANVTLHDMTRAIRDAEILREDPTL